LGGSGWPKDLGSALVVGGLAPGGLVRSENLRAVRRTLNPEGDTDAPAMLEMMERPASRTGTVFASRPDLTLFRSGATAGEGSGTSGRKAPCVRSPQSGVGNCDPAKDPGRRGVDP